VEALSSLQPPAYASPFSVLAGLFAVVYGVSRILGVEASEIRTLGRLPSSTYGMVAYVMDNKVYARISGLTAIAYGVFYAIVSSNIVYQQTVKFSEVYGAKIPSALAVVCCGPVGQFPQFVVYLTEHLGLLIIPLNLILLIVVSWLVGLNAGLSVFAYRNRPTRAGGRWFSVLGAAVGLFTGFPTCAKACSSRHG